MSGATTKKLGATARARRRASITAALFAAAVIIAFAGLSHLGIFRPVDYIWLTKEFQLRNKFSLAPPITKNNKTIATDPMLVAWDDQSAQELPQGWTRAVTARLIDTLSAAHARLIVLDRLYEDPDPNNPPPGTAELAAAMRRAGNVVIGQEVIVPSSAYSTSLQLVPLDPMIAAAARAVGLVNLPPPEPDDPEQLYRSYDNEVVFYATKPPIPSLALAAAKALGVGPSSTDLTFLINFAGPAGSTFSTQTLHDVIGDFLPGLQPKSNSSYFASLFAGNVVFVGDTRVADQDYHPTPVDIAGQMYGVELNMHAFNTILHHDPLNVPSEPLQILIGYPFACLAAAWAARFGWSSAAAIMVVLLAARIGLAFLLFVKFFVWIDNFAAIMALVLAPLVVMAVRFSTEQKARREIRSIFGRYVAPGVVSRICDDPDSYEFEGALRDITVLFSDIRGFTTLSEDMSPQQIVRILNLYFTAMVDEIHKHGGTVDKYVGDAIMALFGAPEDLPDASACAVRAALGMQKRLATLNEQFEKEFGHVVAAGIGLHHGSAAVGIMGCPAKQEYSAIGDTVNTASRLEGFTKEAGFGITASAIVVDALPEELKKQVQPQDLGAVALKGRTATVHVFGLGDPLPPQH